MCAIAEARGYKLHDLKSRMGTNRDFELNDYVLAMDKQNLDDLIALKGLRPGAIPELLMKFSQENQGIEVPDPYYGNDRDFEKVIELIESACVGLLDHILTTYQELQVHN